MEPQQTKIPDRPNQNSFLDKWYEFHRGYRIIPSQDGTESRVAVLGEPWIDVSPGQLPRTLDELRAGRLRSAADSIQFIELAEETTVNGPSLEETLDALLNEDEQDNVDGSYLSSSHDRIAGNVMQPTGPPSDLSDRLRQVHISDARRARREALNFRRVFGTREDVESEDYVSPIDRMFTRAWDRHRQLQASQGLSLIGLNPHAPARQRWEVPYDFDSAPGMDPVLRSDDTPPEPPRGLDVDSTRPEPRSEDQLTVKLDCKVCYTQVADTIFLPCGHLVMCRWCSEQHCPPMKHDHTRPRRPTTCPVCRKQVKQKYGVKVA